MITSAYKEFTIHSFDQLESTNSQAFVLAQSRQIFDHEVIVAHLQTKGRGRQERVWNSPQGNLYFSVVLQPKMALEKISQISFVAAVALQKTIATLVKDSVAVKWPNDLLVDKKKLAGILLESKITTNSCEFLVLGIGVNIESNPDNTIFPATNLKNFGVEIVPQNLLQKFLDEFEPLYQSWCNFGFAAIRNLWLKNAYKLGEEITVKLNGEECCGIFSDFDSAGNLLLKCGDKIMAISAADVA